VATKKTVDRRIKIVTILSSVLFHLDIILISFTYSPFKGLLQPDLLYLKHYNKLMFL